VAEPPYRGEKETGMSNNPIKKFYICQLNKNRGNLTYYGICKIGSQIIFRTSLKTKLKKNAENWQRSQEAAQFLPGIDEPLPEKELKKAFKEYRDSVINAFKESPLTVVKYLQHIAKLEGFFNKAYVSEITPSEAQKFVTQLMALYAPKTIHTIVRFARAMFDRWITYKYIKENPFKSEGIILPKLRRKERPFWTEKEIEVIVNECASQPVRAFWAVMAYAGLRLSEAQKLVFENVDFETNIIRVIGGKGGKNRQIPMCRQLREILTEERKKYVHGQCFPNIPSTPFGCLKNLKATLNGRVFKQDGAITLHRFRHSFASNLLRLGANIRQVQKLLGHEKIETTLSIYSHIIPEDLTNAVDLLGK
jgi:integrase/recombinase XerD